MGFTPVELTPRCRAWIEGNVGPSRYEPAVATATTATVIRIHSGDRHYVLKWFTWDAFVAEDPDRVGHEIFGLGIARAAGLPAPRVVASDADGSATGHPAVLMTAVPGAPLPRPPDWPHRAALATARLHDLEAESRYRHEPYWPVPFVPTWAIDGGLWREAISVCAHLQPASESIIHRDLHRWNMLWQGDRLAGVVDWLSVCSGPVGEDVGRVWINEVLEGNPSEGEAFRNAYGAIAGMSWDTGWELQAALDMLPGYESDEAVNAWGTPPLRQRIEDCLRLALGRI